MSKTKNTKIYFLTFFLTFWPSKHPDEHVSRATRQMDGQTATFYRDIPTGKLAWRRFKLV